MAGIKLAKKSTLHWLTSTRNWLSFGKTVQGLNLIYALRDQSIFLSENKYSEPTYNNNAEVMPSTSGRNVWRYREYQSLSKAKKLEGKLLAGLFEINLSLDPVNMVYLSKQ